MTRSIQINIRFPAESVTINGHPVTVLDNSQCRLEASPWPVFDYFLGDIVEVEDSDDGNFTFKRLVERTSMKVFEYELSFERFRSKQLQDYLKIVVEKNGQWEHLPIDILRIYLPDTNEINPDIFMSTLLNSDSPS